MTYREFAKELQSRLRPKNKGKGGAWESGYNTAIKEGIKEMWALVGELEQDGTP